MEQTELDKLCAAEGESRIDAYEAGIPESIPISQVFNEIEKECGCSLDEIKRINHETHQTHEK